MGYLLRDLNEGYIFDFGKFKGWDLREVYKWIDGEDYINWCIDRIEGFRDKVVVEKEVQCNCRYCNPLAWQVD